MPYVPQERRPLLTTISERGAQEPGDLNYQISTLCNAYLRRYGVHYSSLNAVIGVLECAKLELYRRLAAPYEDSKCNENGDVYV